MRGICRAALLALVLLALPGAAQAATCDYQHAPYSVKQLPYSGFGDFSPDSSRIVYADGKEDLKIYDIASGKVTRTISLPGKVPLAAFWTETGKIFFIDNAERRASSAYPTAPDPLWVMNADGSGLRKLTYPSDVPTAPPGRYWAAPRLSQDGKMMVIPRIEPGSWDIHIIDVRYDGGDVKLANHRILASSSAFFEPKSFSADSKRIVVASSKGSGPGDKSLNSDVFSYDLRGKEVRRYTYSPTWEEDASALEADGSARDAVTFISDRATPNPLQAYYLAPTPNNADWGAVALAVVPLQVWTSHELWVSGPEGDRGWLRRLTFDYDKAGWVARNPHWSPDRRRIIFLQQANQGRGGYDRNNPAVWRSMLLTFDCPAEAAKRDCLNSRGGARGRRLGPAVLGRTRARQRRAFRGKRLHARGGIDRYCATGGGHFRIGYPTHRLRRHLGRSLRARVKGRAVLLLTSSTRFSVAGIAPGSTVSALRRRLRGERRVRVGRNAWYLASTRRTRLVYKTRAGRVLEVGLGNRSLTAPRRAARRFLRTWQLGG